MILKFRFYDFKVKKKMIYQDPIERKDIIWKQWEQTPKCSRMMLYAMDDVNGKEMYDGDIVQPKNNEQKFYKVVLKALGFQLQYRFMRKYQGETWQETVYIPLHKNCYKVVGNEFDNPELLEVK